MELNDRNIMSFRPGPVPGWSRDTGISISMAQVRRFRDKPGMTGIFNLFGSEIAVLVNPEWP